MTVFDTLKTAQFSVAFLVRPISNCSPLPRFFLWDFYSFHRAASSLRSFECCTNSTENRKTFSVRNRAVFPQKRSHTRFANVAIPSEVLCYQSAFLVQSWHVTCLLIE